MKVKISVRPVEPTARNNKMSRNFSQLSPGYFCVCIETIEELEKFDYELLNLGTKQVETSGRLLNRKYWQFWSQLEFNNLQPGDYQLTYRDIMYDINYVGSCGKSNKYYKW